MKALFITHNTNDRYGAAKSLQYILKNYQCEIDLIYPKSLTAKVGIEEVKQYAGIKIKNIYQYWLPFERCYFGYKDEKMNIIIRIKLAIKKIMCLIDKRKIYKLIEQEKYDFVYLNSLIMYPLITERYPFIIHIREILCAKSKTYIENKIAKAKGAIFIDQSTKEPFKELAINNIVLNNPFDMTSVKNINKNEIAQKFSLDLENNTIYSLIGVVQPLKGIDFIITSFKKVQNQNAVLLIVGDGEKRYKDYCMAIAKDDPRILFLGEIKEIQQIYAISDYILRGEEKFCIGRTSYEGLYSGCGILLPGEKTDRSKMFEAEKYSDRIHFYSSRDSSDFANKVMMLYGKKCTKRVYSSNVDSYISKFDKFINNCLSWRSNHEP